MPKRDKMFVITMPNLTKAQQEGVMKTATRMKFEYDIKNMMIEDEVEQSLQLFKT